VALGGAGGARDARDGASDRAITSGQRHHAACDRRAARPIGPARWAGRHPLMSPSEHTCGSAFPRLPGLWSVIVVRRGPDVGVMDPRCLGVSWTAWGAGQRL